MCTSGSRLFPFVVFLYICTCRIKGANSGSSISYLHLASNNMLIINKAVKFLLEDFLKVSGCRSLGPEREVKSFLKS